MTDTQFEKILHLLESKGKSENNKVVDVIFKGVGSLSLMLIVWVLSTVNDMQKADINKTKNQEFMATSIDKIEKKIESFTSIPRFTHENFENKITPIINSINANTEELKIREGRISNLEKKDQIIELRLSKLEK